MLKNLFKKRFLLKYFVENRWFTWVRTLCILADRVVSCPFQKMAAHTVFGQSKVLWHKISTLSTFVLPNFQCIVICWCFLATCCCGGNGPILSKSHEKPHPISNWNLNLMWCLLNVHEFWWNFNMLFISIICNSLGKLFEFYIILLNCCVVKIFALCLSKTSSAIQCGEYLRDLALFDQPL